MQATIASVGELFGALAIVKGDTMIDLVGPMRILKGDDAVYRLTIVDDADARIDLTAATIEMQIKPALGADDPPTIAKSVGAGITLLDQTQDETKGQADINIAPADTASLTPGLFWLDVVAIIGGIRRHAIEPREFTVGDVVNL
jgi:hypothetical protein